MILVFEDRTERFAELERGWRALRTKGKPALQRYALPPKAPGSAITHVISQLEREDVGMAIVDEDLSRYAGNGYLVSSEVKKHCRRLGIPICAYSKESDEYQINETQSWTKEQVTLDSRVSVRDLASKCNIVYSGFRDIKAAFEEGEKEEKRFGEILTTLLGAPDVAVPQVNQYAWGHYEVLSELRGHVGDKARARAVASAVAGYWVFNVLMRFPGALLNETAAASHLGVSPASFRKSREAQKIFSSARYKGPFGTLNKYWWRTRLDEILAKESGKASESLTGRAVLSRKNIRLPAVKCAEANHSVAGYYCILTDKPVCLDHSVAPKRWLPLGSDKSRIRMSVYETLEPLLGL